MVEGFEDTRGKSASVLLYFMGVRISAKESFTVSAMRLSRMLLRISPWLRESIALVAIFFERSCCNCSSGHT